MPKFIFFALGGFPTKSQAKNKKTKIKIKNKIL
jgi:hypothetical protein